jgi:hypothetical protein
MRVLPLVQLVLWSCPSVPSGDLGIMPPGERRMWKDREILRLKDARAEHRRDAISWPDG